MANPSYTKDTVKELLNIFNDDDLLTAFYGSDTKVGEAKLDIIISKINEITSTKGRVSAAQIQELHGLIGDFVNNSPIVQNYKKSTVMQSDRDVNFAESLIYKSESLISEVMKFTPSSKKGARNADYANHFVKEERNTMEAYNTLLRHKIDGTLDSASQADWEKIATGLNLNSQGKEDLKSKSLTEIAQEYDDYLVNNIGKNPKVLAIAQSQRLSGFGHTPDTHKRNWLIIAGISLLGGLITLPGLPIDGGSLNSVLRYLGSASLTMGSIGFFASSVLTTLVTLPKALIAKGTNNKMRSLSLNDMQKVYELIRQNQPSKEKKKKQCIKDINKALRAANIKLKLNGADYYVLSELEKGMKENPLTVSLTAKKLDKKTRKKERKAKKGIYVANMRIAGELLEPIFNSIDGIKFKSPRDANFIKGLLNPYNMFTPGQGTQVVVDNNTNHNEHNQDEQVNSNNAPQKVKPGKKRKQKVEIEEMVGYDSVVEAINDSTENNTTYTLKTKKQLFKKTQLEFNITIKKTKFNLSNDDVQNILDAIENKINRQNFDGGSIIHEESGITIEVNNIKRGTPKKESSSGTKNIFKKKN